MSADTFPYEAGHSFPYDLSVEMARMPGEQDAIYEVVYRASKVSAGPRHYDVLTGILNALGVLTVRGEPYSGGGMGVPQLIARTYDYAERKYGQDEAGIVANAWVDRNGKHPWKKDEA